ncbi:MarR family transcriptional regulator [Halobaculum sp. EA56]|uniref:MarR family transcriptional regulator n=1 Tax=Halobaculum sp. EA56 TaxID=3421648 RepID=UPI003EBDD993
MEFIDEQGPSLPSNIADDDRIPYGAQHIGNRCRKLADAGFLENLGNGVYILTEQGTRYLAGEFAANEEVPDAPDGAEAGANGA